MSLIPRVDPIDARVWMVNGSFPLPDETTQSMKRVREICAQAAKEITKETKKVKYDTGRLIHALDLLQLVKNTTCDAMILPHAVDSESKDK